MSVIGEMRRDMGALAQAFNAPKQLIRDPHPAKSSASHRWGLNDRFQQIQTSRPRFTT
jgi:hypothetical protein